MTTRGPVPKPTEMKRLEGNPGNRALNENEPKPTPAPSNWAPPSHLHGAARNEWERLVKVLTNCGILTLADRDTFATYCTLHGRHVQAELMIRRHGSIIKTEMTTKPSPWITISKDAMTLKRAYAAELGLTPASRSRIGASIGTPPKREDDTPPPRSKDDAAPTSPLLTGGSLIGKRAN